MELPELPQGAIDFLDGLREQRGITYARIVETGAKIVAFSVLAEQHASTHAELFELAGKRLFLTVMTTLITTAGMDGQEQDLIDNVFKLIKMVWPSPIDQPSVDAATARAMRAMREGPSARQ